MKPFTKDVLVLSLAILLTGGMAHAMQPPKQSKPVVQKVAEKPVEAPKKAVEPAKPVEPAPEPKAAPAPAPQPVEPAPQPAPPPAPANDGSAKMFVYMRESGNNPGSINRSSGACGLGQALPCSKMPCSLSDYACQDVWFTNYMLSRYGSWENAKAFWLSHRWW